MKRPSRGLGRTMPKGGVGKNNDNQEVTGGTPPLGARAQHMTEGESEEGGAGG